MFCGIPRLHISRPYTDCDDWDCKCHDCKSSLRRGGFCDNCKDCCKGEGTRKQKCKDYKK